MKFPGAAKLSPNGQHIVYTLTEMDPVKNGYRSNLWLIDKTANGWSEPRQFTVHQNSERLFRDTQPHWSACSRFIYFFSNRSGRNQLWRITLAGGEAVLWYEWDEGMGEVAWSTAVPGLVAFSSRVPGTRVEKKNPNMTVITSIRYKSNGTPGFIDTRPRHLYTLNLKTKELKQITDGKFSESSPTFSPDGKWIAFTSSRVEDDLNQIQNLWRIPVDGGEIEPLTHNEGTAGAPNYSPDGKWIAYLGHELGQGKNGVNTSLFVRPAEGGPSRNLSTAYDYSVGSGVGGDCRADGGGRSIYWSDDSKSVLTTAAWYGINNIQRFFVEDGSKEEVTTGNHTVTSFSMAGEAMAMVIDNFLCGSDIYYYCPESKQITRLTQVNKALIEEVHISDLEPIEATSPDGGKIHGWLMKPYGFDANKKHPMVLEIHGGPYGASGYAFFHEYQLLAANGFAVLFSNPRGSSAYGEKHALGVIGDWGGGDYQDLMAIVDKALELNPWIDPARLGVTGGSYGGYMTNWIVGQTTRFSAAVTLRCISNMYSKYGVADNGWTGNRSGFAGRDLWDSEDFIMERSPIRYAPKVKTPILIIHSEEDYRCPMEQAEQWFVALKRLGVTAEFVRFAGENHELSRSGKPQNRADRLRQILRWFNTHIPADK